MFYGVDEEEMLIVMVGILLVAYLFLILVGIAGYIMNAVALQKIASKRLIQNAWLAWIPIASSWLVGSIADEYDEKNGIKRKWRIVLLVLSLISLIGIFVGYIGMVVSVVMMTMEETMSLELPNMIGLFIGAYVVILVAAIVATALNICNMICLYKIFESTVPEKSVKYLLVSLLVPLGQGICLMLCRNKGYEKVLVPNPVGTANLEAVPGEVIGVEATEETISEEAVEEVVEEVSVEETTSEE